MNYLREKVYKIQDVARHILYKNRLEKLSGKKLFNFVVKNINAQLSFQQIHLIVEASLEYEQFRQIVKQIEKNIIDFRYDSISIKKTSKVISLILQILKNGNIELANELKKAIPNLLALQQTNSQYFNAFSHKESKLLNYYLQNLKQRSKSFLLLQRQQSMALPRSEVTQIAQATTYNLKIGNNNMGQRIPAPKIIKVHSRKQSKNEIPHQLNGVTDISLKKKITSQLQLQKRQYEMESQIQYQ